MPNGGPGGHHFAEGQYAWGYKEGYAQGYREAIEDIKGLTDIAGRSIYDAEDLDLLLKAKFPEQKPPQVADDSEFLPSDVPRESDDDGTD